MTLTREQRRIREIEKEIKPEKLGKFGGKLDKAWQNEKLDAKRAQEYVEHFADLIAEKSGSAEEYEKNRAEIIGTETNVLPPGTQTTLEVKKRERKIYKVEKESNENVWGFG